MQSTQVKFEQVIARGCGLDVHKETIVATIKGVDITEQTQTFSTFTHSLLELKAWLNEHQITHVAMESTGVYWKPVFNILEAHFEIILVNARHIKYVPGHKTDRKDSAWIAKLLLSGLLKGSFIPPQATRELRDLYRYKRKLVAQKVATCNRIHKTLEDANIKLANVVSDLMGKTGLGIINALIAGESNIDTLVDLAKGTLRNKKKELAMALEGCLTEHHIFMLRMLLTSITAFEQQIAELDLRIDTYLASLNLEMTLLQTIPGVRKQTATAILAEIGNNMKVFPTASHLSSWAGVCPGNNESAGKQKSTRVTQGNRSLKVALVEAAWVAWRTKETYLRTKFESVAQRRGRKKALLAIAHKILVAAYFILKNKEIYRAPNQREWLQKKKQAQIKFYLKRLHELGELTPSQ